MKHVLTKSILSQAQRVEWRHRLQGGHQLLQTLLLVAPLLKKTAVIQPQLWQKEKETVKKTWADLWFSSSNLKRWCWWCKCSQRCCVSFMFYKKRYMCWSIDQICPYLGKTVCWCEHRHTNPKRDARCKPCRSHQFSAVWWFSLLQVWVGIKLVTDLCCSPAVKGHCFSYLPACSCSVDVGSQGDNQTASRLPSWGSSNTDSPLKVDHTSLVTALQSTFVSQLEKGTSLADVRALQKLQHRNIKVELRSFRNTVTVTLCSLTGSFVTLTVHLHHINKSMETVLRLFIVKNFSIGWCIFYKTLNIKSTSLVTVSASADD